MERKDLSRLVITKIRRAWTSYTHTGASEEMIDRYCWAIMIKQEGHTYYTDSKGNKCLSDCNHIILAPKGGNYTWNCIEGGWISQIEFEAEIEGFSKDDYGDVLCLETDAFSRLLSIQKEIELAKMGDKDLIMPLQMKCVYDFIRVLLKSGKQQLPLDNHNFKKIRPALEYMSKYYRTEKITNDILSEQCGISTVYFRKLFTQAYGVSPQTCIFRLRMENAKELLKNGDCKNISEVASKVGYDDVYQFSKMFKRYSGFSPKKFLLQTRDAASANVKKESTV